MIDFVKQWFNALLYTFGMILVSVAVEYHAGMMWGVLMFGLAMVVLAFVLTADNDF